MLYDFCFLWWLINQNYSQRVQVLFVLLFILFLFFIYFFCRLERFFYCHLNKEYYLSFIVVKEPILHLISKLLWQKSPSNSQILLLARSISEEFSSGDVTRFRDEEHQQQRLECGTSSSSHARSEYNAPHKSDRDKDKEKDKKDKDKEKEDKDEGK